MNSCYDSRGNLFVDCSECKRGGKGDESCSSGWKIKTPRRGGCFIGELLDKYAEQLPVKEESAL